jgi:molecular chaperone GrpE
MTKKHHHHSHTAKVDVPVETAEEASASASATPPPPPSPHASATAEAEAEARTSQPDDRLLRLAAEYENFRRRTAKERLELTARAQGELVRTLIDPLDDLARVIAQGPGAQDAKTVLDAVEVVDKKMMKSLFAAGLEIVNPVGQPFDPAMHEAVSTVPAATPEEDHLVAQVFQPGYVFKGQLLRAARVVVKQWTT